ncbi:MAG: [LysW]-lysine hydrolase [Chloroflexota bacterium]
MDEIEFLESLIAIPSVSGEEDALAEHLLEQMASIGFRARRDGVGNVIGELGDPNARRSIVLLGHMDTVPGHIPLRHEDGRLYGRGAVDAKGPLAAFVLAAARVAPGLADTCLLVIGAVGEEAHSRGARHLAQGMTPPDAVIISEPGGWQGITLGYKGTLSVDYALTKPVGHGAGDRATSSEEAVAFWNHLVRYTGEQNGDRRPPRFDTLDPTLRSINTQSDGLEDAVTMRIGLRLPPGADDEELRERMLDWSGEASVTFPYHEPAFRTEKNTAVVRALLRAIRRAGGRPRFKLKTGTSDMNVVGPAWGCSVAAYGPGDSSLDHTPDEHIHLAEFRRAVDVLAQALPEL